MRTILLHSSHLEFKPVEKALKSAADVSKVLKKVKECLVAFYAVEEADEQGEREISDKFAEAIEEVANKVKARKIVLYPWVHLTSKPSSPPSALKVTELTENLLKRKFSVIKAPFGWYKEFEIHVKGHPIAELSREILKSPKTEEESEALKKEKKMKSRWYILTPKGKRSEIRIEGNELKGFNFKGHENLKKFAHYEMAKRRTVDVEPAHVKYMRKLELVDYEPGSDPGNLRFYPKGRLIKALIETFVSQKVRQYGAMEIESPIMYDFEHPALKSYLERFPARQYTIKTPNKRVFLRFAACFGQFLMMRDANISYRNLPLKLYELTRYSFRVEQRGELTGLRRQRAFTMPDCHAFCANVEEAKEEMLKRFDLAWDIQSSIGFDVPGDLELALRATKDFWESNKDYVKEMVAHWGKPALIEVWDKRIFYFIFKYEWNFVDALEKAAALNTDQIDVENAERYNISYTDSKGLRKHPIILHQSPSGGIERVLYALLEREYLRTRKVRTRKGRKPELPLWLAPSQVRVCPVSEDYVDFATRIADKLNKKKVRADVDDRNESIGRKVRDAEKEWIPLILVVGEKEIKGTFNVRIRNHTEKKMGLTELVKYVKDQTRGMPFLPLPLPVLMSKRPKFVG